MNEGQSPGRLGPGVQLAAVTAANPLSGAAQLKDLASVRPWPAASLVALTRLETDNFNAGAGANPLSGAAQL